MLLTDATKNALLDELATLVDEVSVHDGYPSTSGANEIAGTTRQAITWNVAASGSLDNNANPVFTIPAGEEVHWIGLWTDAGAVYRGCVPAGGGAPKPVIGDDATDVLTSDNHGFADGDSVVFWGDALPTGLAEGTRYYVRDSATDSFKVSATVGGSAIDLTTDGVGFAQKYVPEVFGGEGSYTVSDLDIGLGAVT